MSADDRILCLIEAFYDAALDDALWPAALKKLMEFTGSQASSFWVLNGTSSPGLPTFIYNNFDPTSVQEYLDVMAPLDPTVRHLVAHPHDLIVHDGLLTNEQDKESRTYYDWHERKIETRFRMVSQARLGPEVAAGVALHRTRRAGRYEARDVERLPCYTGTCNARWRLERGSGRWAQCNSSATSGWSRTAWPRSCSTVEGA